MERKTEKGADTVPAASGVAPVTVFAEKSANTAPVAVRTLLRAAEKAANASRPFASAAKDAAPGSPALRCELQQ